MYLVSPLARQESLIVKELDDETLVYDLKTDKAHCLNQTAARVWKLCDGQRNVSEIARRLSKEEGSPVDEAVVLVALDQLNKVNLLQPQDTPFLDMNAMSRRRLVGRLSLAAALAVPLITSLVAPVRAEHLSCPGEQKPEGCNCTDASQCASGCCENGHCGGAESDDDDGCGGD